MSALRNLVLAGLALALLLPVGNADAQISISRVTRVTGSPGAQAIAIGRTTRFATRPILIRWTVSATGARGVLRSTGGVLRAGNFSETRQRFVNTQLSVPANGDVTTTFDEQLIVPPDFIEEVRRIGEAQITYTRTFQAGPGNAPSLASKVNLVFTGGLGGGFEILHIGLRFDDDTPVRVVPESSPLTPSADLEYNGAGVFEAVWEVADGASTAGSPIFRPLRRERRYLGSTGRLSLPGPVLPTELRGLHLVRLRILSPTPFPVNLLPRARYMVVGGTPVRGTSRGLALVGPADDASARPDTRFAWRRVPGAQAYRLEVYRRSVLTPPPQGDPLVEPQRNATVLVGRGGQGGELVSGVLLPPDRLSTVLPQNVRGRLLPGHAYQWSVRALDAEGRTLAQSPRRAILGPLDLR